MPRGLARAVVVGTVLVVCALAGGAAIVVQNGREAAIGTAERTLEHAARLAENAVSTQILEIDRMLASLPLLLAAVGGADGIQPSSATRVLRNINAQNAGIRDLMLLRGGESVWAATRARTRISIDLAAPGSSPVLGGLTVQGPSRSVMAGDWALFLVRPIRLPGVGNLYAVAEVPVPGIMARVAGVLDGRGMHVAVEWEDGRLIGSLPHDELRIGRPAAPPTDRPIVDGNAHLLSGETELAAYRQAFHPGVLVGVRWTLDRALADWRRDRDRIIIVVAIVTALVVLFALALILALRKQGRLEEDRRRSRQMLEDAIEGMSDGFVMWDAEDRLAACNRRYRELYAESASALVIGAKFEDIIRFGVAHGQYPQAADDPEAFVRATAEWHRTGAGTLERLLPDGRWLLVTERKTANGGTVGIRTDVTVLKETMAKLAEANDRVREAMDELERRNSELLARDRELRTQNKRFNHLAHHDALTGLPNRMQFHSRLEELASELRHSRSSLAVLCLDLDRFKDVNDTLGHPIGDRLLSAAAGRLRDCLRDDELVARLGGDEFAVIVGGGEAEERAETLAGEIIRSLGTPFMIAGNTISIGSSVGGVLAKEGYDDVDTLLKKADMALYAAKARGGGVFVAFEAEMEVQLRARIEVETDLRGALTGGQFELAYQPLFELERGTLVGFEALLRWNHPVRGRVPPAEFIPVAETSGLITEIGAWVLERACEDMSALPANVMISVNLSPVQLRSGDIADVVARALARVALAPNRLQLEITESALLGDNEQIISTLHRLREMGVSVVLDDFGTGYSSLSYLRLFPFGKIKIDRSFVREVASRRDCAVIVRAVVELGRQLGISTTAEGVETQEQFDLICELGCTEAQGYLLGEPQTLLAALRHIETSPTTLLTRIARRRASSSAA